ncbi:tRNA lysidine(34) synthetase TilS [Lutibacter sp. HS1-25]|uniref:tRNA lysidine(34) synthetase TilS n=1 Tax=Lutibacter sp. HS1-25 TaxID=2485000 RepID=UPI00101352F2|nr:tRNA lysidine(34) synthetase TilS [Lutibacter sp. HS1-25]RXP56610.1 tRNA lysidine(34) synthetase TilS [Lutibacter sp. HS1-25]
MRKAVQKHINQNLPFLIGKKILIAISGGIDSRVLVHIFHRLEFDISLAHCNFMLRGKESNKDEEFVKEMGESLQIPTYTIRFDTEEYATKMGVSTQMAARDLRYKWFLQLIEKNKIDYVVTAHQKDDVIETFLINLTRGTGLEGLTGIPAVNGNIVRPLLPFSRNDILIYATKKKLTWREDSSNSSIKYVRNKIRHKVVPFLKELNPNLLESFSNTLDNLKGSKQIIADYIEIVKTNVVSSHQNTLHLKISELKKLSNPKIYLYELLNEYGFTEWDDIVELLDAQSGKHVFSKTHRLLKNRDILILSSIVSTEETSIFEIAENTSSITKPIALNFEKVDIAFDTKNHFNKVFDELFLDEKNTISIDYDKINFPLTIRKKEKGDFFYPIGLNGKKKISKFFKDEKLSLVEKENTWLLCSQNDIVWVIGKRLDDRFKVSKTTSSILKIKI